MTAETAVKVAMAAATQFHAGDHRHIALIGKDTRPSGYMLEAAMPAGFTAMGMDVVLLGPMPTPAVALLPRSLRGDLGLMSSAVPHPYQDNDLNTFGAPRHKLAAEVGSELERNRTEDP